MGVGSGSPLRGRRPVGEPPRFAAGSPLPPATRPLRGDPDPAREDVSPLKRPPHHLATRSPDEPPRSSRPSTPERRRGHRPRRSLPRAGRVDRPHGIARPVGIAAPRRFAPFRRGRHRLPASREWREIHRVSPCAGSGRPRRGRGAGGRGDPAGGGAPAEPTRRLADRASSSEGAPRPHPHGSPRKLYRPTARRTAKAPDPSHGTRQRTPKPERDPHPGRQSPAAKRSTPWGSIPRTGR